MKFQKRVMYHMLSVSLSVILLLASAFYLLFINELKEKMYSAYENNIHQAGSKLYYIFDELKNQANSLSGNERFINQLLEVSESGTMDAEQRQEIKNQLPNYSQSYRVGYDSILCTSEGNLIFSGAQNFFYQYRPEDILESPWFAKEKYDYKNLGWYDSQYMFDRDLRGAYFYIVRSVSDFQTGKHLATVRIGISHKFLINELQKVLEKEYDIFVMNQNGFILASNRESLIETELDPELKDLLVKPDGKGFQSYGGHLYFTSPVESTPWIVVGAVPKRDLGGYGASLVPAILLILGTCVLISLLMANIMACNVTRPVNQLAEAIQSIKKGNFDITVPDIHHDEIGLLGREIQDMARRLNLLIQDNIEKEEKKREAEMKFLRAQINPHFINNTLNSIMALSKMNRNEELSQTIIALTNLMKGIMSNDISMIPLKDELDFLKNYLMIMEIRHNYEFDYMINVNPELDQMKVPRMILQPLVENCIFHGMKSGEDRFMTIGIEVERVLADPNRKQIVIKDSGRGINEEDLKKVREQIRTALTQQNPVENGSIGLVNVVRRLSYFYKEVEVAIESKTDQGTRIVITILDKG